MEEYYKNLMVKANKCSKINILHRVHLTYIELLVGTLEISTVHSANKVAGSLIGKSFIAPLPESPELPFADLNCLLINKHEIEV